MFRDSTQSLTYPAPISGGARLSPGREACVQAAGAWIWLLCLLLLGYALLGRGWAYLGVAPLFVGELTLLLGIGALLLVPAVRPLFASFHSLALMAFMAWGAVCTLPYVPRYGAEALRDAVVWGYASFALLVFAFLSLRPAWLVELVERYQRFAAIFLLLIPVIWGVTQFAPDAIPRVPGSNIPLLHAKSGDVQVHLAGILALWVAGLGRAGGVWLLLLLVNVLTIGVFNRGGMLSFLAVLLICLMLRPATTVIWRMALMVVLLICLMAATNVEISVPGNSRTVSFSQMAANFQSIAGSSETANLDGTKEWRLQWWGDIVQYTAFGPYFWAGKGFGVNLADDDGYQVDTEEGRLRSPHNGHLTVLARAGVPGLTLWIVVQGSWLVSILISYYRAHSAGQRRWAGLFLLLMCYWAAFMVNASFDVFLEGPMGGIWFWTIYGTGLAALWHFARLPELLDDEGEPEARPVASAAG